MACLSLQDLYLSLGGHGQHHGWLRVVRIQTNRLSRLVWEPGPAQILNWSHPHSASSVRGHSGVVQAQLRLSRDGGPVAPGCESGPPVQASPETATPPSPRIVVANALL